MPPREYLIGIIPVTVIPTGTFALDGGAMFGVVPRVLWEKKLPPDAAHRIPMALNTLLIRAGGKNLLVDTGCGEKEDEKFAKLYAYRSAGPVESLVAQAGVEPEAVHFVLNTHLHFDHAGGNTKRAADGKIVPTFPNAKYLIQRGEWEAAQRAHERNRASYLAHNYQPLMDAGRVELLDGAREILPGVRVELTPGHTPCHMMIVVESNGEKGAFVGDLVPTRHHVPLPWVMAYDLDVEKILESKRRVLRRAAKENWWIFFEHDLEVPAARILDKGGDKFEAAI